MATSPPLKAPRPMIDIYGDGSSDLFWPNDAEAALNNHNVIHVHQPRRTSYGVIQRAVDRVKAANPTPEDPWTIVVHPGFYCEAIMLDASNVSLVGLDPFNTCIYTDPNQGAANADTNRRDPLTIRNMDTALPTATLVENVGIHNLRFSNRNNGKGEGGPPTAGLFIGHRPNILGHAHTLPWNNVTVSGCVIDGVHDAIQMFGTTAEGFPQTSRPPLLFLQNNLFRCCHDAYTVKGDMRVVSTSNRSWVNANGQIPWLDDSRISGWKATGFHLNEGSQGIVAHNPFVFVDSNGDSFFVEASDNVGTGQGNVTGVLIYANFSNPDAYRTRWIDTVVRVECAYPGSVVLNGFQLLEQRDTGAVSTRDDHVIRGAMIDVHQRSTDPLATSDAIGIDIGGNVGSEAEVMDCMINVSNAGAGAAYAMRATRTVYRANIFSKQSNAAGGTYLAMPTV